MSQSHTDMLRRKIIVKFHYKEDELKVLCPTDEALEKLYESLMKTAEAADDGVGYDEEDNFKLSPEQEQGLVAARHAKRNEKTEALESELDEDKQTTTEDKQKVNELLDSLKDFSLDDDE